MKAQKIYFSVIVLLFSALGCVKPIVSTEIKLNVKTLINTNQIVPNTFYSYENGDSVMINRLDFYIQNPVFTNSSKSVTSKQIFLYSLVNNTTSFKFNDVFSNTFQKLEVLIGLDETTNSTNPTSVSASSPLNSSYNMYWTEWTKYRFIVMEGAYKKSNGTIEQFTYHTGLNYKQSSSFAGSYILTENGSQTINLNLHIEDIFKGNNNPINIYNGELSTHSSPSEDALTKKFVSNFNYALRMD